MRIFVSSTLLDLREAREQVTRYLSIITTDVLAMEFFGSDDTAPLDYCLSQVDRADVFVGIYAMRYGSVDPTQHRSITELEYRRAFERMRRGQLRLLLYALASDAEWRVDLVETDPESMRKLAEFKSTLSSRHTLKYFRTTDELPLYVLRDVLGIVGIGSSAALKPAPIQPIAPLPLSRPLQMEYYTEDLRDSFFRNPAICDDLFAQSTNERVGLLVGPSGVGKTSLVNAALFPALHAIGWASASARPFAGTPVGAQVWGQLMKGECPQGLSLLEVLVSAAAAHEGRGVVVFLDQFEDLLKHDSALVEEVSDALWHIHSHGPQNLRVLIAYRSDFEAELGSLWQRVSGAAPGLPRVYLSALTRAEASDALSGTLRILGMEADPSLVSSIVADLETQSSLSGHRGVYPPFVQMVVGALFESAGPRTADLASRYGLLGGAGGIISNYLIDSLQYFVGDDAVAARSILIALSSSRGLKSRRTEHQLGGDTRLPPARLAAVLERLVGMRLVRRQNAEYEISHDLLARKVVEELATTDEIEAKRFKELLAARANAFGVTGECLTTTEILYLYRYRSAIAVDEKEGRLLLASHLKNEGPIAYWIRQFPRDAVLAWIGEQSYDPDGRGRWAPLVDLYRMDEAITTSELARAGSYYADPADFDLRGRMLSAAVASDDLSQLLGFASRKTWMDSCSELIRACCDAVVESPEQGVQLLLRSRSAFVSRHRWEIVSRAAAARPAARRVAASLLSGKSRALQVWGLYCLASVGRSTDLPAILELLEAPRTVATVREAAAFAACSLAQKARASETVVHLVRSSESSVAAAAINALYPGNRVLSAREALLHGAAEQSAVGAAVARLAHKVDIPWIKRTLTSLNVYEHAELIKGLFSVICGLGRSEDFTFLVRYAMKEENKYHWVRSAGAAIMIGRLAAPTQRDQILALGREVELPLPQPAGGARRLTEVTEENTYFARWIAAASFAGIATRSDLGALVGLLAHRYWTSRRVAAEAILGLAQPEDLDLLCSSALSTDRVHGSPPYDPPSRTIVKLLERLDWIFSLPPDDTGSALP